MPEPVAALLLGAAQAHAEAVITPTATAVEATAVRSLGCPSPGRRAQRVRHACTVSGKAEVGYGYGNLPDMATFKRSRGGSCSRPLASTIVLLVGRCPGGGGEAPSCRRRRASASGRSTASNRALSKSGASWYYTWGTGHQGISSPKGVPFVPMIWGAGSVTTANLQPGQARGSLPARLQRARQLRPVQYVSVAGAEPVAEADGDRHAPGQPRRSHRRGDPRRLA